MATPSLLTRFNAAYSRQYEIHPLRTLILANGTLSTIADVCAQNLERYLSPGKPWKYDYKRTARFSAFGLAMGPFIGKWLSILERTFPMPATGSHVPTIVKRVLADQVIMAPIGLVAFVGSMGVMEGKSLPDIKEKFNDVYFRAITANWKVWPLIQSVNFGLVPLRYRLPFQQTCGIAWSTYLSLLNHGQGLKEERRHELSKHVLTQNEEERTNSQT